MEEEQWRREGLIYAQAILCVITYVPCDPRLMTIFLQLHKQTSAKTIREVNHGKSMASCTDGNLGHLRGALEVDFSFELSVVLSVALTVYSDIYTGYTPVHHNISTSGSPLNFFIMALVYSDGVLINDGDECVSHNRFNRYVRIATVDEVARFTVFIEKEIELLGFNIDREFPGSFVEILPLMRTVRGRLPPGFRNYLNIKRNKVGTLLLLISRC